MEYLSVPSSSKLVGIALATTVGAEDITVAITKSLTAKGMANVVVSFVEDPAILPFIAKSLSETCHVVLAVAVLNGDAKNMAQFLTKALTETGLETGCPVVPGLMSPASYLELKALLPGCTFQWANSVSSILAVKGGVQPVAVTEIVHESVLAAAALPPIVITAETTNLEHLLHDLRESFKVRAKTFFMSATDTFSLSSIALLQSHSLTALVASAASPAHSALWMTTTARPLISVSSPRASLSTHSAGHQPK
jgi:methylmalonyl-CoA mutase cobalamin-binding subunit